MGHNPDVAQTIWLSTQFNQDINYSTIDNIFNLQSIIQKHVSKSRGQLYVFYVNFLKAFDNCVHSKIWVYKEREYLTRVNF